MFKYNNILYIILLIAFSSCKKDNIKSFEGGNEIFFQKFFENEKFPGRATADSTSISFFFFPDGTQDITVPLVVGFSGIASEEDFSFGLKVVPEGTTANPGEYSIDPSYTFRGGIKTGNLDVRDTIYVKIKRSDRLDLIPGGVRLVVELVANNGMGLGQLERRKAKIIISTLAGKPDWWNTEVTTTLLGAYSEKKFKLFLNEIDKNAELNGKYIIDRPDNAIKMALSFKTWLNNQNPRIREDSGDLMTVPI